MAVDEERCEMGKFQPGQSGNPTGRPKGAVSGRAKALNAVDEITGKGENLAILETALEEALRKKPLWFFINIVMPLLPKEAIGKLESGDRVIEWRGLLSVCGDSLGAANPVSAASPSTPGGGSVALGG